MQAGALYCGMPRSKLPATGNLSDRVVAHLIDYTRRHRLKEGDAVPSEGTLSRELEVSRGVVREAYRSLKAAGILDIANGRTPRVGRLNNQAITQFLHHALHTEQASAVHALDVRQSLEVRAAELAALNRSDDAAAALTEAAAAMCASLTQRRRFVDADVRFHEILGGATGNPLFELLGNALREVLDVTIRAGFDSRRTRAERARVAEIHVAIADAVTARSATRARRTMLVHFREATAFVVDRAGRPQPSAPRRRRVTRSAKV